MSSVKMRHAAIAIPFPVTIVKRWASSVPAQLVKPGVSGQRQSVSHVWHLAPTVECSWRAWNGERAVK